MANDVFKITLPDDDAAPSQTIVNGVRVILLLADTTSNAAALKSLALTALNATWPISEGSPGQTIFPPDYLDSADIERLSTPLANAGDALVCFNRGAKAFAA